MRILVDHGEQKWRAAQHQLGLAAQHLARDNTLLSRRGLYKDFNPQGFASPRDIGCAFAPCVSSSYFGMFRPQRRTSHHDNLGLRLFLSEGYGNISPVARHEKYWIIPAGVMSVNDNRRDTASFRSEDTRVGT